MQHACMPHLMPLTLINSSCSGKGGTILKRAGFGGRSAAIGLAAAAAQAVTGGAQQHAADCCCMSAVTMRACARAHKPGGVALKQGDGEACPDWERHEPHQHLQPPAGWADRRQLLRLGGHHLWRALKVHHLCVSRQRRRQRTAAAGAGSSGGPSRRRCCRLLVRLAGHVAGGGTVSDRSCRSVGTTAATSRCCCRRADGREDGGASSCGSEHSLSGLSSAQITRGAVAGRP